MSRSLPTSEKIMLAALDLMAEKGYDSTTTKEIAAAAGVNEVTLFRHFGSKQNLLEATVDRYHYADEMTKLFAERLEWDLHRDLLLIGTTYHRLMNRNSKLIRMMRHSAESLPEEVRERSHRHPRILKQLLTDYFKAMTERGKLVSSNPEHQALAFIWMNYGAAISRMSGDDLISGPLEAYIEDSVGIFARALTP
ncbi:TetR/AcrR family transcriptional regulator [Cohnella sp. 56]|uniref:TetR/AcrR family transcriptional regulator n=1 Tax=Cohnella sp. 56 TaxID=3113722 RepID=UPI0030E8ABFD